MLFCFHIVFLIKINTFELKLNWLPIISIFINKHIFRYLKLEIALVIPASNDEK